MSSPSRVERSAPLPVDQGARDTISRLGLDRTLFVEAGAGTGKTTQLVERIVNLVMRGGVRLSSVAAITFTEAAASELRSRVRDAFETLAAESTDPSAHQQAVEALAEADLAAISTLHGFAQRILSEHPTHSGLPPRIGVLDEVNSVVERAERWERFVDRLYDDPAHEDLLVRAEALGIAVEAAYAGQSSLEGVAAMLNQSWDRLGPVASQVHPPLPAVDFGPFDQAAADLVELPALCTDPTDKFFLKLGELIPRAQAVLAQTNHLDKLRAMTELTEGWGPGNGGAGKAWTVPVTEAKDYVRAVEDACGEVLGTACHEVLIRLITLVAAELVASAEARRVEGRLEFHDLLVLARRLLTDKPAARAVLHDRYTHLLLDEFQDTDPLQIHLAVLIAAAITGEGPAPMWNEAEVDEGRLFFVGDPKQSIYRFRRADIELFLASRNRFGVDEALQRLSTNFRTVAPVLDWINAVFHHLMPTEIEGRQPAYVPLDAYRGPSTTADHRPVLLGGPQSEGTAAEIRQAETAEVAEVVADIRDHPERWPVGDGAGGFRPAALGDVTILIPTRTELPALQAALSERDLPHHLATGTLIFQSQEVRDLLSVLGAVDDPSDELILVAALRSPLYGCSDADLFTFHQAGGRWDLRREPPVGLDPTHPVVEALAHLRALWEQRWWVRPSELLSAVIYERHAEVVAFGGPAPEESWSRLRFIVDQALAFEEAGGGDLRAFLRWAELQGDETVTVHQPVGPDGVGGAVSIMTIHGSKGLEFPITIVSGTSARPPVIRGPVAVFDGHEWPEVHLKKGHSTHRAADLLEVEKEMAKYERTRLLYVAATRARDHLVVSAYFKVTKKGAGNDSFGHQVWEAAQEAPGLWRSHQAEPEAMSSPEPGAEEGEVGAPTALEEGGAASADVRDARVDTPGDRAARDVWSQARSELLGHQRSAQTVSATAIAAALGDVSVSDYQAEVDADDGSDGGAAVIRRRRGRAGTAIGRATHATLQLVDLHDPSHVEAEARRQAQLESIPELTPTVISMVRSALESPTVAHALSYHREVFVAAPVGQRVIEGFIDLLIETDHGLVVVDYKTDQVRSQADIDSKVAVYELQGAAYAVALEAATGLAVVDMRFIFCRPSGAIERAVPDLAAAMARLRSACEQPTEVHLLAD